MDADKQEINFLELIFTDEIYGTLVRETNLHAQDRREAGSKMESSFTKEEIKAHLSIRMWIYMSKVKLSETRIYSAKDNFFWKLWYLYFCTVTTRDRFDKIFPYFHTDDRSCIRMNARETLYWIVKRSVTGTDPVQCEQEQVLRCVSGIKSVKN